MEPASPVNPVSLAIPGSPGSGHDDPERTHAVVGADAGEAAAAEKVWQRELLANVEARPGDWQAILAAAMEAQLERVAACNAAVEESDAFIARHLAAAKDAEERHAQADEAAEAANERRKRARMAAVAAVVRRVTAERAAEEQFQRVVASHEAPLRLFRALRFSNYSQARVRLYFARPSQISAHWLYG